MTDKRIYIESDKLTDDRLKALFDKKLPEAGENPWFTPRVMNRLPRRNRWASGSILQWVCYALGAVALIIGIYFSGHTVVVSGFNLFSITTLLTISLLVTVCGAILTFPSLIRILREP